MNTIKKRFVAMIFLITLIQSVTIAQDQKTEMHTSRPLNNINLNVMGNASIFSLNYERLTEVNPNFIIAGQLGIGMNEEFELCLFSGCSSKEPEQFTTIPFQVTANVGIKRHFLELGYGMTTVIGNTSKFRIMYPIVGYRYLPDNSSGLSFNFFIQIPTNYNAFHVLFMPGGIKLGYSF